MRWGGAVLGPCRLAMAPGGKPRRRAGENPGPPFRHPLAAGLCGRMDFFTETTTVGAASLRPRRRRFQPAAPVKDVTSKGSRIRSTSPEKAHLLARRNSYAKLNSISTLSTAQSRPAS